LDFHMNQIANFIFLHVQHVHDAIAADKDTRFALMVFVVVILAIPFDATQLFLLMLGAALAAIGQHRQSLTKQKEDFVPKIMRHNGRMKKHRTVPKEQSPALRPARPLPKFQAVDFAGQIEELVSQLDPDTTSTLSTLASLSKRATEVLCRSFPDAEVLALASGDIGRNSAFAVAVPEVHLVVTGGPVLTRMLEDKARSSDIARANKAAVQSVVSLLIQNAGFKFRRSAFRTSEPKVTLLAPEEGGDGIVLDIVVNGFTALQEKAIVDSCGLMDARAKALVLLVRRWAKHRGLCHTSQGHLSPYAWSLLTISYLQQADILPVVVTALGNRMPQVKWGCAKAAKDERDVPTLLSGFMQWCSALDWASGVVTSMPTVDSASGAARLHIEDPFNVGKNMASGLSMEAIYRNRTEIDRAAAILAGSPTVAALLEPWIPHIESTSS
jgi:hypothetical protein